MKRTTLQILALGGIAGPILFTVATLVSASLRPDYNQLHNFISELGATNASTQNIMNFVGFVPSGILISLFGISLLLIRPNHINSKIGSFLIMIFGLGMTSAGVFSCDPGCPAIGSMESLIHDRVSAITFASAILGIGVMGFSFKRLRFFRNFALYSILTSILSAIFMAIMISSFESRIFTGLWQRLLLLVIFLWTIIIGIHIFKNYDQHNRN